MSFRLVSISLIMVLGVKLYSVRSWVLWTSWWASVFRGWDSAEVSLAKRALYWTESGSDWWRWCQNWTHLFWILIFSGYKPNSALQASLDVHLWTPKMFLIISSCGISFEVLSLSLSVCLFVCIAILHYFCYLSSTALEVWCYGGHFECRCCVFCVSVA